jgi:acetylornithine deacetylase/succinyl-diaminopimelate desuccinylase-like protein
VLGFVALYPVMTAALWVAGGIMFKLIDERGLESGDATSDYDDPRSRAHTVPRVPRHGRSGCEPSVWREPTTPGRRLRSRVLGGTMQRASRRTICTITATAALACGAAPAAAGGRAHAAQADSEVVTLDRDLVRLNTVNPPGATASVAEYMRARLAPLGFEVDVIQTPDPGKAHVIARLRSANPTGKPVLLCAHADTVGVEREFWSADPFAGVIRGDYLYGRGSLDDKGGIAVFAAAAMRLARAKVPLTRDIVLVFEADEEGGEHGIEWLADTHWDKLDAAFSLNEGGIMSTGDDDRVNLAAVTVRDKISLSVVLRTRGTSTHSSRPEPPSAIDRLARALTRISRHRSVPRLSSLTRTYFRALARASEGTQALDLRRLAAARDSGEIERIGRRVVRRSAYGSLLNALIHTTFTNTIVDGGIRSNVIPGGAEATVNMRLLPGVSGEQAVRELRRAIDDPKVKIVVGSDDESAAEVFRGVRERQRMAASSTDSELYSALAREVRRQYRGAVVTPALYEAATDAGPWRQRGIPVYGIRPYRVSATDLENMHGIDERVSVTGLNQGTDMVERILRAVATR